MAVIDIFEGYFPASCVYNGRERHAAKVTLTSDSEKGQIRYEAAVTFFPHDDEEDFAVSYDAYASRVIYEGKGRRSKKKEKVFLEELPDIVRELSEELEGKVDLEHPLREVRLG